MTRIEQIGADITHRVSIESGAGAARIEGVEDAIGGRVKIDVGVVGKKAIRTAAQIVVAETERVGPVKIKVGSTAQNRARIDETKRKPRLGDVPLTRIDTAVESYVDIR